MFLEKDFEWSHICAARVDDISVNPQIFFLAALTLFLFLSVGIIEMASWPAMKHHLGGSIVLKFLCSLALFDLIQSSISYCIVY